MRGAARFETRLRPSDTDWANYKAGSVTWMNLPWVQGIYGSQAGLRQVWVRMELQFVPGVDWIESNAAASRRFRFSDRPRCTTTCRTHEMAIRRLHVWFPRSAWEPVSRRSRRTGRRRASRQCVPTRSVTRRRGDLAARGMALLMVLLLLSLTLGLSYAAMRSMSTSGMIQRNSDRRASARQAAITGLSMALKKMRCNDWAGVDTSLSGSLNSTDTFLVTYTTGDPRLSTSDTNQPYRVTLLSTGYSADPEQTQAVAIYRVRAIVGLIPRKLADEPTDWTDRSSTTRSPSGLPAISP